MWIFMTVAISLYISFDCHLRLDSKFHYEDVVRTYSLVWWLNVLLIQCEKLHVWSRTVIIYVVQSILSSLISDTNVITDIGPDECTTMPGMSFIYNASTKICSPFAFGVFVMVWHWSILPLPFNVTAPAIDFPSVSAATLQKIGRCIIHMC